jgi:Ca2+-transporting ATPase
MSDAFSAIVAVLGSMLLGLPLAVTAAQILWVNLISDGFPDLALTVDPKDKDVMRTKPVVNRKIMERWMKFLIGTISAVGGLVALSLFFFTLRTSGDVVLARSVAFLSLGVNSLFFVYSVRTLTAPFWERKLFENKWLNLAVIAGFSLQFLPFIYLPLGRFLGVTKVSIAMVGVVFVSSVSMFFMIEVMKSIFRKGFAWFSH